MYISVITVNYNNCDGLQKTIDSVIAQTFKDFEWIVIDGGSTDGSRDLLERYTDYISYWVSEPDRGIFHAMNKGIVKAEGEYLLFLNSGDYLVTPEVLMEFFQKRTIEDFVSGDIMVCVNGKMQVRKSPDKVDFYLLFNQSIPHQATFIKRSVFERFGMYNETNKVKSDWENSMRSIVVGGATYKHIDLLVSFFDVTGISNDFLMNATKAEEQRRVYLSLMPAYVLETLEYYKKEERVWKEKSRLYDEYMTLKNGKMGVIVAFLLWVKKLKRSLKL